MLASDHDGISQQHGDSCQHACRREAAHVHANRRSRLDVAVENGSLVEVREAQCNVTRYFNAPEAKDGQHANAINHKCRVISRQECISAQPAANCLCCASIIMASQAALPARHDLLLW